MNKHPDCVARLNVGVSTIVRAVAFLMAAYAIASPSECVAQLRFRVEGNLTGNQHFFLPNGYETIGNISVDQNASITFSPQTLDGIPLIANPFLSVGHNMQNYGEFNVDSGDSASNVIETVRLTDWWTNNSGSTLNVTNKRGTGFRLAGGVLDNNGTIRIDSDSSEGANAKRGIVADVVSEILNQNVVGSPKAKIEIANGNTFTANNSTGLVVRNRLRNQSNPALNREAGEINISNLGNSIGLVVDGGQDVSRSAAVINSGDTGKVNIRTGGSAVGMLLIGSPSTFLTGSGASTKVTNGGNSIGIEARSGQVLLQAGGSMEVANTGSSTGILVSSNIVNNGGFLIEGNASLSFGSTPENSSNGVGLEIRTDDITDVGFSAKDQSVTKIATDTALNEGPALFQVAKGNANWDDESQLNIESAGRGVAIFDEGSVSVGGSLDISNSQDNSISILNFGNFELAKNGSGTGGAARVANSGIESIGIFNAGHAVIQEDALVEVANERWIGILNGESGNVLVDGGQVTVNLSNAQTAVTRGIQNSGTFELRNSGVLNVTLTQEDNGFQNLGGGTLTVDSTSQINIEGNQHSMANFGHIENDGTINLASVDFANNGTFANSGNIAGDGSVTVTSGGLFTNDQGGDFESTGNFAVRQGGRLLNSGGNFDFAGSILDNDGTVDITGGTVSLGSNGELLNQNASAAPDAMINIENTDSVGLGVGYRLRNQSSGGIEAGTVNVRNSGSGSVGIAVNGTDSRGASVQNVGSTGVVSVANTGGTGILLGSGASDSYAARSASTTNVSNSGSSTGFEVQKGQIFMDSGATMNVNNSEVSIGVNVSGVSDDEAFLLEQNAELKFLSTASGTNGIGLNIQTPSSGDIAFRATDQSVTSISTATSTGSAALINIARGTAIWEKDAELDIDQAKLGVNIASGGTLRALGFLNLNNSESDSRSIVNRGNLIVEKPTSDDIGLVRIEGDARGIDNLSRMTIQNGGRVEVVDAGLGVRNNPGGTIEVLQGSSLAIGAARENGNSEPTRIAKGLLNTWQFTVNGGDVSVQFGDMHSASSLGVENSSGANFDLVGDQSNLVISLDAGESGLSNIGFENKSGGQLNVLGGTVDANANSASDVAILNSFNSFLNITSGSVNLNGNGSGIDLQNRGIVTVGAAGSLQMESGRMENTGEVLVNSGGVFGINSGSFINQFDGTVRFEGAEILIADVGTFQNAGRIEGNLSFLDRNASDGGGPSFAPTLPVVESTGTLSLGNGIGDAGLMTLEDVDLFLAGGTLEIDLLDSAGIGGQSFDQINADSLSLGMDSIEVALMLGDGFVPAEDSLFAFLTYQSLAEGSLGNFVLDTEGAITPEGSRWVLVHDINQQSFGIQLVAVPEPSGAALLFAMFAVVALRRRVSR